MLHYARKGEGEVLVLIHGFLGGMRIFDKVYEALQQNYDVIRIDLPGHGESEIEQDHYTMKSYANDIIEVLHAENVRQAYWLGHSMGGYIALAALQEELFDIPKVILAYSTDGSDNEEAIAKRTAQQIEIGELGGGAFIEGVIHAFLAPEAKTEDILYAKEVANEAQDRGLILALAAMKAREDQTSFLADTKTPILVLEGTFDKAVAPITTGNPAIQKVQTETGHLGMIEDQNAFIKAINDFLMEK